MGVVAPKRLTGARSTPTTRRDAISAHDVLEATLSPPPLRRGNVRRAALVNRLRAFNTEPLVAIVAPAGYGKTTLLAQWAARDRRPFAWLSVDDDDNDPFVLVGHLAAALDRIGAVDPAVVEALQLHRARTGRAAVSRLGVPLASAGPLVFVLDDFDRLRNRDSLAAVSALVDLLPERSQVALAGRAHPLLPLARLRAEGRLHELGVGDIRLELRETRSLLRSTGVKLSDSVADELTQRAEGWAAGVYLTGLALATERSLPDGDAAAVAGDDRFVADYLRVEVLSTMSPDQIQFLTRTAVLERMSGPLCDAVLQRTGSAAALEQLERSGTFIVPLDRRRQWYRYHSLFGNFLRRELEDREPDYVPELTRRAADWCEANSLGEEAVEYALTAGEIDRAAELVASVALPLYNSGRIATVRRWLSRLDAGGGLEQHPGAATLGAWVQAWSATSAEAERWAVAAEGGSGPGEPAVAVLRAAMCRAGIEPMRADAERALGLLPEWSSWRPTALLVLGISHALAGDDERGDILLAEAADGACGLGLADTLSVALAERCLLATERGATAEADAFASEARTAVSEAGLVEYPTSAIVYAATACAALRKADHVGAQQDLAQARRLCPPRTSALPWLAVQARLELARAHIGLADPDGAGLFLADAAEILRRRPNLGVLSEQTRELRSRVDSIATPTGRWGSTLTEAELRVLSLLTTHLSFREIAQRLYVSRNTVKSQAISVYRKLGANSRSQAIKSASELGLVDSVTVPSRRADVGQ